MFTLAEKLYPLHRSITGDNNRKTLREIKKIIPIHIQEVKTGTKAFDWTVPKEWKVRAAYIKNDKGEKIIDISNHNLHILSYSIPFKDTLTFKRTRTTFILFKRIS